MRPPGPLPSTPARSSPASAASRRASGEALTRPPATPPLPVADAADGFAGADGLDGAPGFAGAPPFAAVPPSPAAATPARSRPTSSAVRGPPSSVVVCDCRSIRSSLARSADAVPGSRAAFDRSASDISAGFRSVAAPAAPPACSGCAAAGAPPPPAPPTSADTSSSAPAITPITAPTGAVVPAPSSCFRSTPLPRATSSIVALSVSISAMTSPSDT
jgi:hypothetical protein